MSQNKIATQSTTSSGPTDAFRAGNAVDRDITTCMRTYGIGLLTSQYKSEWWKVDLGGVYNIYSINILFKNYQGYGIVLLILHYHLHVALFEHMLSFFHLNVLQEVKKLIFCIVYMLHANKMSLIFKLWNCLVSRITII